MSSGLEIREENGGYALARAGKPLTTPKKKPLLLPTRALAQAVAEEWGREKSFSPSAMPLTAIAFTALDVLSDHRASMLDAMLAYAETDLLLYRSEVPALSARQRAGWDPLVEWAQSRFDCALSVTYGVMPLTLPDATLSRLRASVEPLDDFALAAFSVLTQGFGSLLLALAVREGREDAAHAFTLSRIDEDFQAEQWGEDSVVVARAQQLLREMEAAEQFLKLLVAGC